jgi:hypothetical protein
MVVFRSRKRIGADKDKHAKTNSPTGIKNRKVAFPKQDGWDAPVVQVLN